MMLCRTLVYLAVFYTTGVAVFAMASAASLLPNASTLVCALLPVCLLAWVDTPVRLPPLVADFTRRKRLRPRGLSTLLSTLLIVLYTLCLLKPYFGTSGLEIHAHRVDPVFYNAPNTWFSAIKGLDAIRPALNREGNGGYIVVDKMDNLQVLKGEIEPSKNGAHDFAGTVVVPEPGSDEVELRAFGRNVHWRLPPTELYVRGLVRQRHNLEAAGFKISDKEGFDVSALSGPSEDQTEVEAKWYGVRLYSTTGSEPSLSTNLLMGFAKSSAGGPNTTVLWALGQDLSMEPFLVYQTDLLGLPRLALARESDEPYDLFGIRGRSIAPRLRFEAIAQEWRSAAYKSADDLILYDNRGWFHVSPWEWVGHFDIDRSLLHSWVSRAIGWLIGCALLLAKARQFRGAR